MTKQTFKCSWNWQILNNSFAPSRNPLNPFPSSIRNNHGNLSVIIRYLRTVHLKKPWLCCCVWGYADQSQDYQARKSPKHQTHFESLDDLFDSSYLMEWTLETETFCVPSTEITNEERVDGIRSPFPVTNCLSCLIIIEPKILVAKAKGIETSFYTFNFVKPFLE